MKSLLAGALFPGAADVYFSSLGCQHRRVVHGVGRRLRRTERRGVQPLRVRSAMLEEAVLILECALEIRERLMSERTAPAPRGVLTPDPGQAFRLARRFVFIDGRAPFPCSDCPKPGRRAGRVRWLVATALFRQMGGRVKDRRGAS